MNTNFQITKSDLLTLSPFLILFTLITLFVKDNFFLWDTVQLGSEQAHWFYDNNFRYFFLPPRIDSGHPPLFGAYLAVLWTAFERTLPVSHLAMLPFVLGIIIQLYFLLKLFIKKEFLIFGLIFLLTDPTLLAQSTLISPDISLLFFFLLSLYCVFTQRKLLLTFSLVFLALISMRGMMHVVVLYIIDTLLSYFYFKDFSFKNQLRKTLHYVPSGIFAGSWLLSHYIHTGWIGYHEESPWAVCFEKVDVAGFIKNIFIMGWRMADFGRVLIWLLAVPLLYISIIKKKYDKNTIILLVTFGSLVLLLSPNLLLHKNLLAHRYLLTVYIAFALLIIYQVQLLWPDKFKLISLLIIIGLLTGNFWRYPDTIDQGWDSSLAHYPYYKMRREMIDFIDEKGLDKNAIGSVFPNVHSVRKIDLSDKDWRFAYKNLDENKYFFFSNLLNGLSDDELKRIKSWEKIKELNSHTVDVILYKNPDYKGL